jgi:hypothetical protein
MGLCNFLPIYVSVLCSFPTITARQWGLPFDQRRDWPVSVDALTEQSNGPPSLSQMETECCLFWTSTSNQTEMRTLSVVLNNLSRLLEELSLAITGQGAYLYSYLHFATTCFGLCWPSSGGIYNILGSYLYHNGSVVFFVISLICITKIQRICCEFINLAPLSLLLLCKLSFPVVSLKMSSLPTLGLKFPNKMFISYLENLLNTRSNSP